MPSFPLIDGTVAFRNQICGAPEVKVGGCGTEISLEVLAATTRFFGLSVGGTFSIFMTATEIVVDALLRACLNHEPQQ